MPVDLSSGRFYAGKSARARAPWPCPNCGVVNAGPLVMGCTNCGSGKPPEGGIPNHAGVGPGGGLTRADVADVVIEVLQRAGVMAPPLERPKVYQEEVGSSALGEGPSEGPGEISVVSRPASPVPVVPLTLPEIDTSDPRVRLTIAEALRDWGNYWDNEEGTHAEGETRLSPVEAHALAAQIAPELVGEQVEPPPVDEAEAAQQVEVGEQHKREILSRLRAPNSKS